VVRNSSKRLRSLAAGVDERHREAMERLRSRRRFLTGVGAGSAALTIGAVAGPALRLLPAGAQEGDEATDADLATFLASIELVAVDVYETAVDSGFLSGEVLAAVGRFRDHHDDYATALDEVADATPEVNRGYLDSLATPIEEAIDETSMLNLLLALEQTLVATYVSIQGEAGTELAAVGATIAPVEGQQIVVIGHALDLEPGDYLPALDTVSGALDPAAFPPE
jgi:hypothetical protein